MRAYISYKKREQNFVAVLKGDGKKVVYVGTYESKEEAEKAVYKVLNGATLKEVRTTRKMDRRNISGMRGLSYDTVKERWRTVSQDGQYLGQFIDKADAIKAMEVYDETGERKYVYKNGVPTRGVSWDSHKRKWRAYSPDNRYLGVFDAKDDAAEAVRVYKETGERKFVKAKGRPRVEV